MIAIRRNAFTMFYAKQPAGHIFISQLFNRPTISLGLTRQFSTVNKPKKTLKEKAKEAAVHYWNGSKLLVKETSISSKLLLKLLRGETLIRRERQQLMRSTADMLRLVPFLVFVIVPFMEFLLPVALKLFPNMLPSTFEDSLQAEEKKKKLLKVRLQVAKFLQDTVEEMASSASQQNSIALKEFNELFRKVRETGEIIKTLEIVLACKKFESAFSLEDYSRPQLISICKYLNIRAMGTDSFIRYQINKKMQELRFDDEMIVSEGIESLNTLELISACHARGFKIIDVPIDLLKLQLKQWIDLHVKEQIPPALLLLSRMLSISPEFESPKELGAVDQELAGAGKEAAVPEMELGEKVEQQDSFKKQLEIIEKQEELIASEIEEHKEKQVQQDQQEQMEKLTEAVTVLTSKSAVLEEKKELKELLERSKNTPNQSALTKKLEQLYSKIDLDITTTERELGSRLFKIQANYEGQLTIQQLESILGLCKDKPKSVEELVKKFDLDNDGRVFIEDILKLTKK